jgi:hypothetical protein
MVLDHVDNSTDEYVLQNTSFDIGGPVLRIPKTQAYYVTGDVMFKNCYGPGEYKFYGKKGEFMSLANERFGNTMKPKTWYLLPQAYSITLVPEQNYSSAVVQVKIFFVCIEFKTVKQMQNLSTSGP